MDEEEGVRIEVKIDENETRTISKRGRKNVRVRNGATETVERFLGLIGGIKGWKDG